MAALLGTVKAASSLILGDKSPSIDNWTFRLFYQWSTSILLTASVLVTSNQFFGSPIQCDLAQGGVSDATLKSYCWMYSTFNIPDNFQGDCARRETGSNEMYNRYYQWVSLCLVGQACLFYVPRALWLSLEGGLMKHLAKDKQGKLVECPEEKCASLLLTYKEHLHNKYNRYFFAFFLCELLNLTIAVGQLFITDKFLGHTFLYYGAEVYRFYQTPEEEREINGNYNPMCQSFPRVASCTYYRFGAGGGQESLQALCILSLNIIIDKVYLVLWAWYIFLIFFGTIRILQRLLETLAIYRYILMRFRMHRYFKTPGDCECIRGYINTCSMGDWFVLYQMSKNMNRRLFYSFLNKLTQQPALNQPEDREVKDEEMKMLGEKVINTNTGGEKFFRKVWTQLSSSRQADQRNHSGRLQNVI